jgi:hypothetical protein
LHMHRYDNSNGYKPSVAAIAQRGKDIRNA